MHADWRPIYARNIIDGRTRCIDLHRQSFAMFSARINLSQSTMNSKKPTILLPSRNDVGCEVIFSGRYFKQHATSITGSQSTLIEWLLNEM